MEALVGHDVRDGKLEDASHLLEGTNHRGDLASAAERVTSDIYSLLARAAADFVSALALQP